MLLRLLAQALLDLGRIEGTLNLKSSSELPGLFSSHAEVQLNSHIFLRFIGGGETWLKYVARKFLPSLTGCIDLNCMRIREIDFVRLLIGHFVTDVQRLLDSSGAQSTNLLIGLAPVGEEFLDSGMGSNQFDYVSIVVQVSLMYVPRNKDIRAHDVYPTAHQTGRISLWNLLRFFESMGPGPLRCYIVLDEAHRLAMSEGSPVERLLREGRKFGVGVILASQQPEDFTSVAYTNTATKLAFQLFDTNGRVVKQLRQRALEGMSADKLLKAVSTLPRGSAYVVTSQNGAIVNLFSYEEARAHGAATNQRKTR